MMKQKITLLGLAMALFTTIGCTSEIENEISSPNEDLFNVNGLSSDRQPILGQYIVTFNEGVLKNSKIKIAKNARETKSDYLRKTASLLNQIKTNKNLGDLPLARNKISEVFGYALEGFVAQNLTPHEVEALKNDPRIKNIEQDYVISLGRPSLGERTTPAIQEIPWGITRIGGFGNGTGKTAWVIDSGVDLDHPDLNVDIARSLSFTGDNNPNDGNGHGTHVAGIIAAKNNTIGVVGVAAGAKVIALKVLGDDNGGEFSWVVQALDFVSANASAGDVVNMSFGPGTPYVDSAIDQATINVASKGIKIAIAAGNNYDDANLYSPSRINHANTYTISAIAQGDYWAYFSNYGTPVDYAAPGYNVKSTWLNGGYNTISGTSMASPHAAGILLLGTPTTNGYVKAAYWEYNKRRGNAVTGRYGGTNSYSLSLYRYDKDGVIDPIIHR